MAKKTKIAPPPAAWKYKMEKKLKKEYPGNDEAVFATINKIWYHNMNSGSRAKAKKESFLDLSLRLERLASQIY